MLPAGSPTKGPIARVEVPQLPKIGKKTLDGRAQPPDLGDRRQKKNYPAVKIHPGKFERGPQKFFPIGHYNSRNLGKCFLHFGREMGPQLPRKNYPAVKIHPGKFEDGPQKFLPMAVRLGT